MPTSIIAPLKTALFFLAVCSLSSIFPLCCHTVFKMATEMTPAQKFAMQAAPDHQQMDDKKGSKALTAFTSWTCLDVMRVGSMISLCRVEWKEPQLTIPEYCCTAGPCKPHLPAHTTRMILEPSLLQCEQLEMSKNMTPTKPEKNPMRLLVGACLCLLIPCVCCNANQEIKDYERGVRTPARPLAPPPCFLRTRVAISPSLPPLSLASPL